ncbi:MAG: hypothetical protein ACN4GG_02830 [Akkermansiaceae bacterium]
MSVDKKYWFRAKRRNHGYGWDLPLTWHGWFVLAAYLVFMIAFPFWISPATDLLGYLGGVTIATGALVFICWKTGEPPKR